MRKAKRQTRDAMMKYRSTANGRVDWVLLGYVLVLLEGDGGLRGHIEGG